MPFPFTALVGQSKLRQALLLNVVNPAIGGVLVSGVSGTGKSTAVRGLAELMPPINVVEGCLFGCDPTDPVCAQCRDRIGSRPLPSSSRPRRVVDLPLNATEDRVAGTVDLTRVLNTGERVLEPGLLAQANRGVLYVDEINLLDDQIADLLLDAAASGVNVVEREGISVSHPARFLLVGTMNPEEGELRPQLADRIGLRVEVPVLRDRADRGEVIRRREAFGTDPGAFLACYEAEQSQLRDSLQAAVALLPQVGVPDGLYGVIADVVNQFGISSHRADVTVLQCAKAGAALQGRRLVDPADLREAAALALRHRATADDPFDPAPEPEEAEIRRRLDEILGGESVPKAPSPAPKPRTPQPW